MKRLAIAAVIALTACAAQQRDADMAAARQACDLRTAEGVGPIVGKIPMSPSESEAPSIAMLALEAVPTPNERAAIDAYTRAYDATCTPAGDAMLARYYGAYPEIGAVAAALRAADRTVLADLYLGRMTYAKANQRLQSLHLSANNAIARINEAYRTHQQAKAAALLQAWADTLPRTTTCVSGAGFASCTTR